MTSRTGKSPKGIILSAILIMVLFTAACGMSGEGSADASFESGVPDGFAGEWECEDLASDGETDTSFYAMWIEEDGGFSMYDAAAGNPGISGMMGNATDHSVDCVFNMDDFDVPFCWEIDGETATLEYELEDDTLRLGHNDVWMVFHRLQEAEEVPVPDPIDMLLTCELPSSYKLEMEYPYNGEDGWPIVERAYGSEHDGYLSMRIFSFQDYDCLGDVTETVNYEEYVNALDNRQEITIGGEAGWYGTRESDDMPDMVAVAYVQHGDYVFEFRLTNYDEQVTVDQMKEFERILGTVVFL